MPRPSKSITVNENDIIMLQNLAEGLDQNLAMRARIILTTIDHPSAKETAEILGVDQRTVALWKEHFNKDGIHGLQKTYGGGPQARAARPLPSLLEERVNRPESWTVASLAQEFNTTSYAVSKALKQAGIDLNRTHMWECPTIDNMAQKTCSVHALYLAHDVQAIVLCCSSLAVKQAISSEDQQISDRGILLTRNRLLANDIIHSATPLTLADTIVAATNHCQDEIRTRRTELSSFLESVIPEVPQGAGIEYHVYAHAESRPVYRGFASAYISYLDVNTTDNWEQLTYSWMETLSKYECRQSISDLMHTVQDYLQKCRPSTEPFCWKKEDSRMRENKIIDEKDTIQQSAERLLEQMGEAGNKSQVGAVFVIRDEHGVTTQEVIGSELLPSAEELDYSSPEAIGLTLGKAERAINSFVRDLALKLEQQYAEDVKKNEVQ